jgi:hypothetical protein
LFTEKEGKKEENEENERFFFWLEKKKKGFLRWRFVPSIEYHDSFKIKFFKDLGLLNFHNEVQ